MKFAYRQILGFLDLQAGRGQLHPGSFGGLLLALGGGVAGYYLVPGGGEPDALKDMDACRRYVAAGPAPAREPRREPAVASAKVRAPRASGG